MVKELIRKEINHLTDEQFGLPIETLGIDSIDLVTLRVKLEKHFHKEVPDEIWLTMNDLNELVTFFASPESNGNSVRENAHINKSDFECKRSHIVNMPQMAIGGLSESWLFKELGDFHWYQLCNGLSTASFDLKDNLGNRLYATFVRIRFESNLNLSRFQENEEFELGGKINRFGNSMYFTENTFYNSEKSIHCCMMTTFSTRGHDNSKLTKGQPNSNINNQITELAQMPSFGENYRNLRKSISKELILKNEVFRITDEYIFELEYELNPFHDINGVNLLYFAAYPIISDFCEYQYLKKNDSIANPLSSKAKDVFYFNNCNASDTIIYRLCSIVSIGENQIKTQSTLSRKSDGALMARIFSIKEK